MRAFAIFLMFMVAASSPVLPVLAQESEEPASPDSYPFDSQYHDYMTYEQSQDHLAQVHADHPGITEIIDLTSMIERGRTYEGRSVWAVRISNTPGIINKDKEKVVILGPVHGDEWMGYEICLYTIDYLTDMYNTPPTDNDGDGKVNEDPIDDKDNDGDGQVDEDGIEAYATWLVDTREIYIVPMPNPDGTEQDRKIYTEGGGIWRKNMRDNNNNGQFDSDYDGVDLNRNYPYMWSANRYLKLVDENGVTVTQDSSYPGSSQYHGPPDNIDDDGDAAMPGAPDWWSQHYGTDWNGIDEDPYDGVDNDGDGRSDEDKDGGFSEPETQCVEALMKLLDSDRDYTNGRSDVSISLTYHAVIGMILYPWGYTQDPAPDNELLVDIAARMSLINEYTVVKGTDLYPTSGDSDDWFYASMGTLAYTIEVAPIGNGGFHPEPIYIINQTRENLGVNLYLMEIAELARVAKDEKMSTIDVDVPILNHSQSSKQIRADEDYKVSVSVLNGQNLAPDSLKLYYRTKVDGSAWGKWEHIHISDRDDSGNYKATIPGQDGRTSVQYYFEAKDARGPTVSNPSYAHAEPYQYRVNGFLGMGHIDPLAIVLIVIIVVVSIIVLLRNRKRFHRSKMR